MTATASFFLCSIFLCFPKNRETQSPHKSPFLEGKCFRPLTFPLEKIELPFLAIKLMKVATTIQIEKFHHKSNC